MRPTPVLISLAVTATLLLGACASGPRVTRVAGSTTSPSPSSEPTASPSESPVSIEPPVPVESSPPGDIPDDTQFVPYHSKKDGWTVTVPEGWSRTRTGTTVTFTDKLNTVVVSWQPAAAAPTVASAKAGEVPQLLQSTRAFTLVSVTSGSLPADPFVLVRYRANSDPNPVTGKQYRLDVLRYELFKNGEERVITLLSPVGADNVDPWNAVTQSFKWS